MFNQSYRDVTALQISDSEVVAATVFCREVIKNKLNKG